MTHPKLDLVVRRPIQPVDLDLLPTIKHLGHACDIAATGYLGKTIAAETGIDSGTWTNIQNGTAGVKDEWLCRFMDFVGSELPLAYLNWKRGYDPRRLHRLESDLERENRELREALDRAHVEREVITKFMREVRK